MRKCFIHIGTHKTGTTSLQVALRRSRSALQARLYLYPDTGRPAIAPDGHHNLAWEVTGDRRFEPRDGTIDDLIAEIADTPRHVILSSEDFECSVHHAHRFRELIRRLQACEFDVQAVLYLRNQVDYCQSLYVTMVMHGIVETFDEYLDDILSDGLFKSADWVFEFNYESLVRRIQQVEGVELIVRSYDRPSGSLIADFLAILGLIPAEVDIDPHLRIDIRPDIIPSICRFYSNRTGTPLDPAEQQLISALFGAAARQTPIDISPMSKQKLVDKFGSGALRHDQSASMDSIEGAVSMESLFSTATIEQIAEVTLKSRR